MGKSLKWAFLQFIKSHKLITSGQHVLVAVSGGIDSMALLSLIDESQGYLQIEYAVVHINHKLRGEDAEADEKFIRQYCKAGGLMFFRHSVNTKEFARKNKYSIEEAGHLLREKIFREYLKSGKYDLIATGHNLNDQAETILMRIIEGTGFHGLSGIRLKKRGIIRPLLFASRKEIEEYIKEKGVAYRHDNSNLDLRFKRNRIRHKLIPFVSNEFNRLNLNQFLNLSLIFQEWEDYSKKILDHILSKLFVDDAQKIIKLDKRDYQNYFSGIQIKLLEYISSQLSAKKVVLSFNKFRDFNNWLSEHREGKYYRIIPEVVVREHRDNITFQYRNPESLTVLRVIKNAGKVIVSEMGFEIILTIVNKEEVKFTNNPLIEFVDGEKSNFPVILRTWKAGDRFKPLGMKKNRLVSDFLTDLRLDYLMKKSTLLLEKEDKIVAIPGIRVSNDFRVTNTSKQVLKIEVKNIDESG